MTPKEKAKELFERFDEFTTHHAWRDKNNNAIECALIAVDEILEALEFNTWQTRKQIEYYEKVKQEIQKL